MSKRLLKELSELTKSQNSKLLLENDYLVAFDEENLNKIFAIIKGPKDSLYRHKFIRLDLVIPSDYPHSPPKVSFVNRNGARIHPTLYEDGRCCCTILNTWPSIMSESNSKLEAWTSSFGIETVILTFLSFLDNEPYTYEGNAPNNQSYNDYVLYQTWDTCLIRYLIEPQGSTAARYLDQIDQPELFTIFIKDYILANIEHVFNDLYSSLYKFNYGYYYTKCFDISNYIINYEKIINILQDLLCENSFATPTCTRQRIENVKENVKENDKENIDYQCNICFDTVKDNIYYTLHCNHSFHKCCLRDHINVNDNICSMCRTKLTKSEILDINYIINPLTKRRVKIGGKTYKKLIFHNPT